MMRLRIPWVFLILWCWVGAMIFAYHLRTNHGQWDSVCWWFVLPFVINALVALVLVLGILAVIGSTVFGLILYNIRRYTKKV